MSFAIGELRVTSPSDPASQSPISLATQAPLTVDIYFEGIAKPVDYRVDPRTNISVAETGCAYVEAAVLLRLTNPRCTTERTLTRLGPII